LNFQREFATGPGATRTIDEMTLGLPFLP